MCCGARGLGIGTPESSGHRYMTIFMGKVCRDGAVDNTQRLADYLRLAGLRCYRGNIFVHLLNCHLEGLLCVAVPDLHRFFDLAK